MNSSINLVSNRNIQLEKGLKRIKAIRTIALISLIFVSAVSIIIFILNLALPLQSVKKDQQDTIASIALQHKKLATYTLISDRAKKLQGVISQRKNYASQVNTVLAKVPADTTIDALEIEKGKISIAVSSTSLLSINKFINDTVALGSEGKILKNVVIQGLSVNTSGGKYVLAIRADIR